MMPLGTPTISGTESELNPLMKQIIAAARTAGVSNGKVMRRVSVKIDAPDISAASSRAVHRPERGPEPQKREGQLLQRANEDHAAERVGGKTLVRKSHQRGN